MSSITIHGSGNASYTSYRNSNYEDIKGLEIKLARNGGRFINGWLVYEKSTSRTGEVGLSAVATTTASNINTQTAYVRTSDPSASFKGLLRFGTPGDWGNLYGNWSLSIVQSYASGGEVVYNPDGLEYRELPDSYFLQRVDSYNTDMKLAKMVSLPGGRSLSFSFDITNLWNRKTLNGSVSGYSDYLAYLVDQNESGDDLKVGEATEIFTHPYQTQSGRWEAPISPRTEWLQSLNPRFYRLV